MPYKDPNDPEVLKKRAEMDFEYANSERGFVTLSIARRFKPSVKNMAATKHMSLWTRKSFGDCI